MRPLWPRIGRVGSRSEAWLGDDSPLLDSARIESKRALPELVDLDNRSHGGGKLGQCGPVVEIEPCQPCLELSGQAIEPGGIGAKSSIELERDTGAWCGARVGYDREAKECAAALSLGSR